MNNWNKLTNILLEKNHIKILIEKRFFLSFLEDDENHINKHKVLNDILKLGFLDDDSSKFLQKSFQSEVSSGVIFVQFSKTSSIRVRTFFCCLITDSYCSKSIIFLESVMWLKLKK